MNKLLLFDLDGTLLDTVDDVLWCSNETLKLMGLPEITAEIAKTAIGPSPDKFAEITLGDQKHRLDEFFTHFRPIYYEHCVDHTQPFDGIMDLLDDLNGCKKVVTTNKKIKGSTKVLNTLNLWDRFDGVYTADLVENPKPAPDMLLKAIADLGVDKSKALMVGDTGNDILAANAAGIQSCFAEWGYATNQDELRELATFSAKHPRDVLTIIKNL